jgi:glycerol-3-phosphate O-acyltransferase
VKPASAAGELFSDSDFRTALLEAAAQAGKPSDKAEKYARKCLKEIEATPTESWLRPAAKMARFIYTRSYEAQLDINLEALEALREKSQDKLLLFLWSHKSHMDSFVFLLSLYEQRFKPLPLIFAGINMNFLGFGALARRVGAIFLRRSFQEDPIYKLVFKSYIDHLIRHKVPLSWSIEGTRSRTGKLSPPKLGILNWVVEACERQNMKDVLLVPVSIAFDRIAEIDDYVAIQTGQPKRKESLRWFLDYIFGMRAPNGKVYIRYGEPLALGEDTGLSEGMLGEDGEGQHGQVTRMAFEVCRRIEQITPIKSADVLTMVLLGANQRALTSEEIYQQASAIAAVVKERELPAASGFRLDSQEEVAAAVLALQGSGLVKAYEKADVPVYYIPQGRHLAAAYYRNTITHYFLRTALGEIGLAMCALDIAVPNEQTLREHVMSLRDLYKFEFFYKPTEEFWADALRETNQRYGDWASGQVSVEKLLREHPPRFGHAILRSITECYLVTAVVLEERGGTAIANRKKFTGQLLAQGEQMLLRRTITCEAAVSQDLFSNALRLADYLQLLSGPAAELEAARTAFAQRVINALSAINLLQRSYDAAWFSKLSAGRAGGLLGP